LMLPGAGDGCTRLTGCETVGADGDAAPVQAVAAAIVAVVSAIQHVREQDSRNAPYNGASDRRRRRGV
jgi:hypothetical protein